MADLESYFGTVKNDTNVADANKVVDENTESNAKGDDYMYGLSEAAAVVAGRGKHINPL